MVIIRAMVDGSMGGNILHVKEYFSECSVKFRDVRLISVDF